MSDEPRLEANDIQGHVLPGFGCRHVVVLGVKLGNVAGARQALLPVVESITPLGDAEQQRRARRRCWEETGTRLHDSETRIAMSLSAPGLSALGVDLTPIRERRFTRGMHEDAAELLDLVDDNGVPRNWVVGQDREHTPDVLLILESDDRERLRARRDKLLSALDGTTSTLYCEEGTRPLDDKEHFGFRDGVSQPAVRGYMPDGTPLARRTIPESDVRSELYAAPGRLLVWPGQFVFGYPTQGEEPTRPGPIAQGGADWMKGGSYLVFRRLRQEVGLFRAAMAGLAEDAALASGRNVSADDVAARLVGRWPDGTPLVASPSGPDANISKDSLRINHFGFASASAAIPVKQGEKPLRTLPSVPGDPLGLVCPHMAHIRKINPRDDVSDIGTEKNAMKLILRRGASYGPSYDTDPNDERGLLFFAYQTSLDKQFVFLQRNWANALSRPGGIGHDPIIGRTSAAGNKRSGRLLIGGVEHSFDLNGDWVVPTGGCYVFTPSLSVLRDLLDG